MKNYLTAETNFVCLLILIPEQVCFTAWPGRSSITYSGQWGLVRSLYGG